MPDNSFDIVSKIDLAEVANAIQQAMKEVSTRFDLKDSKSQIAMEGTDAILLHSADEYKMKAVNDILQAKLVKRGVPLKGLTYAPLESAAGNTVKQKITLQQGIPIEKAREIVTLSKKLSQWSSSRILASICSLRTTGAISYRRKNHRSHQEIGNHVVHQRERDL